jgi:hypothetical protein
LVICDRRFDATTGGTLWLGPPREADNTAVAKASRTGFDPIARYTVADSATWAQPAISGNRIFVKDTTSLSLWTLD